MARAAKSGVRIRHATGRDLEVLVRHRRLMWEAIGDHTQEELDAADREYRNWARRRLKTGKLVGFLAEAPDGRILAGGCVWLRENQPRPGWNDRVIPYLLSMYTESGHRGRGLATRIVQEAIRWSRSQGYARLVLHASDEGRGVYEKLGFMRTWEMRYRLSERRGGRASRRPSRLPAAPKPRSGTKSTHG